MQEIFDLRDGDSFPLQPGLPPGYGGIELQGSISHSGQTASGLVVLQHFERTGLAIQLGIYKFLRLVHCFLRPPVFPTTATIALKNELRSRIEGIGSFTLKEGEFSFLHYGEESILADFKAEREYQLLEVSCSPELLAQTIPYFQD